MKLTSDLTRCGGTGNCVRLAPDIFDIADNGSVIILTQEIEDGRFDSVREAVAQCPTGALALSSDA